MAIQVTDRPSEVDTHNVKCTGKIPTETDRDKSVTSGKSTIMMRCSAINDLCDEDAIVSLHMLITYASRNAESKPYTETLSSIYLPLFVP